LIDGIIIFLVNPLTIFAGMINMALLSNYLRHRFTAKTRHGVHSPFVYHLVDEVIYDFHAKSEYMKIEQLRSDLLQDKRVINVTDLGAGSHLNNNKKKPVKTIAKNALKSTRLAQLIFRLARDLNPGNIIELGTCLGVTTGYLATAVPQARVTTLEGCPETASIAAENLRHLDIKNVQLKVGNFDEILPAIIEDHEKLDFVFLDGNHRKEATLNYFRWCLPKLSENGVMIFDDIYWSKGMKEAWQEIKADPRVSVTIDLFWIGLVFIRPGQMKEDFKIKF
jgi:predicted O-methyltransferase YrrM